MHFDPALCTLTRHFELKQHSRVLLRHWPRYLSPLPPHALSPALTPRFYATLSRNAPTERTTAFTFRFDAGLLRESGILWPRCHGPLSRPAVSARYQALLSRHAFTPSFNGPFHAPLTSTLTPCSKDPCIWRAAQAPPKPRSCLSSRVTHASLMRFTRRFNLKFLTGHSGSTHTWPKRHSRRSSLETHSQQEHRPLSGGRHQQQTRGENVGWGLRDCRQTGAGPNGADEGDGQLGGKRRRGGTKLSENLNIQSQPRVRSGRERAQDRGSEKALRVALEGDLTWLTFNKNTLNEKRLDPFHPKKKTNQWGQTRL